ncbi:hypothetical protein KUTeg_021819 [Tegillarca granosa]|uniref:Uncharacterized protein n=1 Tax=Tegillarca granosa TaxID=220873 RepID=A0ABQ9EA05_TEGGR|nr:hypothetical protein KUTeg_021819 [Tegillarca granosa]
MQSINKQNLEACLKKDPHLAIGHYHKGMQNLKLKRHREADTDFDNAIEKMRGCPYIDYSQLGLVAKLHTYQIQSAKAINLSQRGKTREAIKLFIDASQDTDEDEFKRHAVTCIHELKTGQMLDPNELCPNCLFYPPKNLIANLKKREYVGKAKVNISMR